MSNPDVLIQLQLPTLAGAPTLPVANRAELRAAILGSLGSFLGAAPDVHIVDTPTANGAAATTIGVWEAQPRPLERRDHLLQTLDFVGARPRDGINVNLSMVVHDATMRRLLSRTVAADVDPAQAHVESTDIEFDDGINTATTVLTVRRIRHFGGEGVKVTLRWKESLRANNIAFTPCALPQRVLADTDRNLIGDIANFFNGAIPEVGVLGALATSGLFVTRVPLNIDGLGPIALDVSYDHFDIRTTGVLTGLVVDAHAAATARKPCVAITGPSVVRFLGGDDLSPTPAFSARTIDLRNPTITWTGSNGLQFAPSQGPDVLAVFPFDPSHRIASRVFTITVTAIDADGTVQPNGLPVQLVRPVTFEMPILAQVP